MLVDSRRRTIPDNSEEQVTRDCTEGEQNRRIAAENLRKRALGKPRNGKAFEPQVPTEKHRAQDGGGETERTQPPSPVRLPSVDTDEGEHEYAEATKVDDAAGVEDVILCCGRFFCWSKATRWPAPLSEGFPLRSLTGPRSERREEPRLPLTWGHPYCRLADS